MTEFDLATINGLNGFMIVGADFGDGLGHSGAIFGDFNNDGFDDILAVAPNADPDGRSGAGEAYIVFGNGGDALVDLAILDGATFLRFDGEAASDSLGSFNTAAAGIGDFNGDGIDDVIFGAASADPGGIGAAGSAYVVFGATGLDLSALTPNAGAGFDLADLDGSEGFRLPGLEVSAGLGRAVGGAGDINGDGFDDLIIGVNTTSPEGRVSAGEAFIVFGTDQAVAADFDLAALDGADGFRLFGGDPTNNVNSAQQADLAGRAVDAIGDFNADGLDDLLIGTPGADQGDGGAFVVFGKTTPFDAVFEPSALDGSDGFQVTNIQSGSNNVGAIVSGAGDVNGDGFDDFVMTSRSSFVTGIGNAGQHFVIFGREDGIGPTFDLTTLDATEGFRIDGAKGGGVGQRQASGGGDVNGDGFDDIIVGSVDDLFNGVATGAAYVVFGAADAPGGGVVGLASLDASEGITFGGGTNGSYIGYSLSIAGDTNGDGLSDIMIGAPRANSVGGAGSAGRTFVVFGFDPAGGITNQGDQTANDLTGDATANGMVGADGDDILRGAGGDDVITGGDGNDTGLGQDDNDTIFGGLGDDILSGGLGDDRLSGGAGADDLTPDSGTDETFGGSGDDRIFLAAGDLSTGDGIDGGGGADRAELSGGGAFDFSAIARFTSVETIITGDEGYLVTGGADGEAITGGAAADTLNGDGGDDTLSGGAGVDSLTGGAGDDVYILAVGDENDSIAELAAGGLDTVQAAFNFILPDNVENLILTNVAGPNVGEGNGENNQIDGSAAADNIRGRNGDDILVGGDGADTLTGDAGADALQGGDGNDRLNGGTGADAMSGGAGNDIYTVDDVGDVVTELSGEGTTDRINVFVDFVNPLGVEFFVGIFSSVGLTLTGNAETNRISGANRINSPDVISGEGGNDRLVGLVGDDTINGGDGRDRIFGNSGHDIINGGDGDDVVTGQFGNDVFIVGLNAGSDAITDFNTTDDQIDLSAHGFLDFAAVQAAATDENGSAVIDLGGGNDLRLLGVLGAQLQADDFILI